MDTLSGPVGPGPQGPETGQAWHGPTQWVCPLGSCPWLLDLLCCPEWEQGRGRGGWEEGMGVESRVCAGAPAGPGLDQLFWGGSVSGLGGSGRR